MIRNRSAAPLAIEIPPEIHGHIGRQFQKSRVTRKVDPGPRDPDTPSDINHIGNNRFSITIIYHDFPSFPILFKESTWNFLHRALVIASPGASAATPQPGRAAVGCGAPKGSVEWREGQPPDRTCARCGGPSHDHRKLGRFWAMDNENSKSW